MLSTDMMKESMLKRIESSDQFKFFLDVLYSDRILNLKVHIRSERKT